MTEVTDITSIPLYQILGAPLLAMVQAETQAAKATAEFIEQVGFISDEAPATGFGRVEAAYEVISELTGLSTEDIDEATAKGQTLAEIVEESGASVEEVRAALMELMADVQLPEGQDVETWIDGLLSRGIVTDDSEHHYGELRTVTFRYTKMGVGGQPINFKVEIPVLSIVPIPAIQISDARVEFAVEINDAVALDSKTKVSAPRVKGQDNSIESELVMFKAGVARRDSKTAMHVTINVKQADTPVGLLALFKVMEQGISSVSEE